MKSSAKDGRASTARRKRTSPVNPPQQERSEATLARILNVVETMVDSGRYESATVSEIVRRARCSVGAFYGRFADKDAALYSLYDARCRKLEVSVASALDIGSTLAEPLDDIIVRLVDLLVDHAFDNAAFIRAEKFVSVSNSGEPFWRRAIEMNAKILAAIEAILKQKKSEMRHPDEKTAALMFLSIVGGLSRDVVTVGGRLGGKTKIDKVGYKREILRAARGYLGMN